MTNIILMNKSRVNTPIITRVVLERAIYAIKILQALVVLVVYA